MKLEKLIISVSFPGVVRLHGSEVATKKIKAKGIVAWGLAIHQEVKRDSRLLNKHKWIVTHIKSGRRVLYDIPTEEAAIGYMMKLHEICEDWRYTEEELKAAENFETLREYVFITQGEINDNNKSRI